MYTALRATSLTLVALLRDRFTNDQILRNNFDPARAGNMIISLNNPEEMSRNHRGLSVWLYKVVRDAQRLNAPPERITYNQVRRTPLPFCLYYLMTPIVDYTVDRSAETEQLIMGKVLQVFHDSPLLIGSSLAGEFAGTKVELRVRLEPASFEETTRIWDAFERSYQLSVAYEVSVVYIDSEHQPMKVSPVEVALPEYGIIVSSENK